jgi:FRG domain
MQEQIVNCWEEFEDQLRRLDIVSSERAIGYPSSSSNEYLFRGHSDSSWLLETTLDRFFSRPLGLFDYYRYAVMASSKIGAFTGVKWNIPSPDEYKQWLKDHDQLSFHDFKAYDYLAYLRHHGFPSPLLDWSQSPYIAAFFAFRSINNGVDSVAVYAYQEYPGVGKIRTNDAPCIHKLGPYVSAHKRHFLQQSQYTFCTEIVGKTVRYTTHQNVVSRNDQEQDLLWKFIIPVSKRRSFLARLNRMNINSFSLFGSEDSLVETIALSDIYVRGRDL